ncbi:hypothetical protein [Merismopedia glauca]|uniref:hypothetical protein n=1 Tax=Merismopedia glauca TaxID=292586 RepID=UPI0015E79240|nr:hypothetical protein [Merismopedia glauca]
MTQTFGFLLVCLIIITVVVYVLRGISILTFIPGGAIWLLLLFTILTAILYNFARVKRY